MAQDFSKVVQQLQLANEKLARLERIQSEGGTAKGIIAAALPEVLNERVLAQQKQDFDQRTGITEVDEEQRKTTQVLADKHGLDFKAFRPKMPKMLQSGPIKNLSKEDIASLTAAGYFIKPPTLGDNRSATNEAIEIVGEINVLTDRLNYLMIHQGVRAEKPKEEPKKDNEWVKEEAPKKTETKKAE